MELVSGHNTGRGGFIRCDQVLAFMKTLAAFFLTLFALTSEGLTEDKADAAFRVASFNIHYILDGKIDPEGPVKWEQRRDAVSGMLVEVDADIVAFQEMETFAGGKFNKENKQLDWILSTVPGYKAAAVGDPSQFPSTQPILYRAERFKLVDQGWFYFSETPDKLFSASFDGGFDHYASTARLKDRQTGHTVTIINVHTDIRSFTNRRGATRVIAERVKTLQSKGERVIVLGDFNATSGSANITNLTNLGLKNTGLVRPTYHFGRGLGIWPAIDHILHGSGIEQLEAARIHQYRLNGVYPSDHYPISALYRLVDCLAFAR
jgi:endonuclease/exonuclease/phosphatase family metal-dependent hydrolase